MIGESTMKTLTLEFQEEISLEQCNMIYKLLEAVNLKVNSMKKIGNQKIEEIPLPNFDIKNSKANLAIK